MMYDRLEISQYAHYQHWRNTETHEFSDFPDVAKLKGDRFFLKTAKHAITEIIKFHKLTREDEVYIVTTSNSAYVSSCVTCTIFNHCKVSRVLTKKTKLIFVIHEFGFPCEKMIDLRNLALNRGIPMVEDSAHSLNSSYLRQPLGSFGDYLICSLPKNLPMKNGGLLVNCSGRYSLKVSNDESVKSAFLELIHLIEIVSLKRRSQYAYYDRAFPNRSIFGPLNEATPSCYSLYEDPLKVSSVYERAEIEGIELLKTHNPNWISVPLNPWFRENDVYRITSLISELCIDGG